MAAAAPSRATPPASRRSASVSSTTSSPPSIHKGATARSAVSPRVSASLHPPARRASIKGASPPLVNGETRESLSVHLKQETEKKEQALQLQDKDQTITTLKTENDSVTSALHAAESRLTELYADQNRMEEEMSARIEVAEKLRSQVRELEKEKRDLQRRYNEQTATFEAERQAFYDNEQHLKSRIQSLSQARKQPLVPPSPSRASILESEAEDDEPEPAPETKEDVLDAEEEPAEMTALKLELSTLSTSYTSLQSTLLLLQTQLVDLKRVNNELQEENESYNILLREKTLNGQFDVLKMGGSSVGDGSDASGGEEEDDGEGRDAESLRSRATGRSTLDRVDEAPEHEHEHEHEPEPECVLDPGFEQLPTGEAADADEDEEMQARNPRSRHSRKRSSVIAPRGESLANLPITGPGLDLAAELGRAENKDILDGHPALESEKPVITTKNKKKSKKGSSDRKISSMSEPSMDPPTDLDALRNEVKSLKDANKALSLYASKIIDRIISQEGFEHVLAVDYEKSPTTPGTAGFTTFSNIVKSPPLPPAPQAKKARPQSAIFSFGSSSVPSTPPIPQVERLTTFDSPTPNVNPTASPESNTSSPPAPSASSRRSRRSMSFDWKSFSMFGGDKKPEPSPNLRPLTLRAGTTITGARKLDTLEDEDDRRERERLAATMKLMGIEKPPETPILGSPVPPMLKSYSAPEAETPTTPSTTVAPTPSARFSFFRRTNSTTTNSDASSISSSPRPPAVSINTAGLTQEALEQAEAEGTLAALDAHERHLSAEIAKGSGGGFTELSRRSGDRRSSRRSGSGSTVWSAGMSKEED
ncbi:hypothetical protein EIP91_005563 [Steccherinum ochraceum]|uniref:Uncharacterized protein n=1 Tax=Steccherinum ochraceum TaxID=92696 RepID=A0A4R0S1H4_9APHY|nr:hypothetical protein EIP91_005563 [Steccherinum ochraceum]